MAETVFILNGPNLNLLGVREPELYGSETLDDVRAKCLERAQRHRLGIDFRQSNYEGALVESVHEARDRAAGVIINPAGLYFTSVPLLDALKTFSGPIIEVHITNIHRRGEIYNRSLISHAATGVIAGLGGHGYLLAVEAVASLVGR